MSELPEFAFGRYSRAIVIPARSEGEFFHGHTLPSLVAASQHTEKVLLLLVVNSREGDSAEITEQNDRFLRRLGGAADSRFTLRELSPHLDLLLVNINRSGERLLAKEGVGRARKIGSDIFVRLWQRGIIASPWIFASDADVIFAQNYFTFQEELRDSVVLGNVPFEHFALEQDAPELRQAIRDYDWYLRYYVAGLSETGSRYAHPTIGSTQVIRVDAYVNVRGYPNLLAGEDFYLASKLLKVGDAYSPRQAARLQLSGRISERVPFGTGTSVKKISGDLGRRIEYRVYHPDVFNEVRNMLAALRRSCEHRDWDTFRNDVVSGSRHAEWLTDWLERGDERKRIEQLWTLSRNEDNLWRHVENYFDAFKILKFIHELRDERVPSVTPAEAVPLFETFRGHSGLQNPPELRCLSFSSPEALLE